MRGKTIIAAGLAALGLAFAQPLLGPAPATAFWPKPEQKAKNCRSESGSYPPGTIVDTTITTRDANGNVVTKKVRYICGQDGKWHRVATAWRPGLSTLGSLQVVRAARAR